MAFYDIEKICRNGSVSVSTDYSRNINFDLPSDFTPIADSITTSLKYNYVDWCFTWKQLDDIMEKCKWLNKSFMYSVLYSEEDKATGTFGSIQLTPGYYRWKDTKEPVITFMARRDTEIPSYLEFVRLYPYKKKGKLHE